MCYIRINFLGKTNKIQTKLANYSNKLSINIGFITDIVVT